jgi:hypothetical protein
MKGGVTSKKDDCIKIWTYFTGLQPVISEIFELLFGSVVLYTARVPPCTKEINYFLNEENIGSKCPNSILCDDCKDFKKKFCSKYHIAGPKPEWVDCTKNKLRNISLHWLPEEIVFDIAKYSSYDVEVELRNIYEKNYIDCIDSKHEKFKDNLKSKSIMFKDNESFLSTNYWFKFIFKIIVLHQNLTNENNYKKLTDKYGLFISEKNKNVNTCNQFLITNVIKNEKTAKFLDSLGICYSKSDINDLNERRYATFGNNFVDYELRNKK